MNPRNPVRAILVSQTEAKFFDEEIGATVEPTGEEKKKSGDVSKDCQKNCQINCQKNCPSPVLVPA